MIINDDNIILISIIIRFKYTYTVSYLYLYFFFFTNTFYLSEKWSPIKLCFVIVKRVKTKWSCLYNFHYGRYVNMTSRHRLSII